MSWQARIKNENRCKAELNTLQPWAKPYSLVLVYPNTYYVGMSSLGFQTAYRLINESDMFRCDRAFLPDPAEMKAYRREGTLLKSFETERPLGDFDVIAFSLSFEMDYFNIATILELAGVPLMSTDRHEGQPLLLAGGIAVQSNPEPLAAFFDGFLLGDGEVLIPSTLETIAQHGGTKGVDRDKLLSALSEFDYVPSKQTLEAVIPIRAPNVNDFTTESAIYTSETEFSNMCLVEISRGCPWRCGYCLIGNCVKPYRVRSLEMIKASIDKAPEIAKTIGIVGSAIGEHPHIKAILRYCLDSRKKFSLASLNLKTLDEDMLDLMEENGTKAVTIAPEAGSDNLRQIIQKRFTNEEILDTVQRLATRKFETLKLYFMIGLPGEKKSDIEELCELSESLHGIFCTKKKSHRRLVLSINPFIPKRHTRFAEQPMADRKHLSATIKHIRKRLSRLRSIGLKTESLHSSYVEYLLSVGGREMGDLIRLGHELGNLKQALKQFEGEKR